MPGVSDAYHYHPFHPDNNINGIVGDDIKTTEIYANLLRKTLAREFEGYGELEKRPI
jgi:hypothetical protein